MISAEIEEHKEVFFFFPFFKTKMRVFYDQGKDRGGK